MNDRSRRVRLSALASLAALLVLGGCATQLKPPISGYACCNLPTSSDIVYASNVLGGPIVPAGEAIRIETSKRDAYFWGYAGGSYVGFTDDVNPGSTNKVTARAWINRIVVAEDPARRLATWPADVQNAIRSGKVFAGMTREQVLVSLGYPSPADVPDVTVPTWRYWTSRDDEPLALRFAADGRLEAVDGPTPAKRMVEYLR